MTRIKNACLFAALSGILLMSCQEKATTDEATVTVVQTENDDAQTQTPTSDTEYETASPAVTLQHGVQWSADEAATNGIKNMITLLGNTSANADVAEYATLRERLEAEYTMIMTKTTMTGDSRKQLDNYLMPMKVLFENLVDPDPAARQTARQKLNEHLRTYRNYFQ